MWLNSLSDELSSSANRLTDLADGVLLLEVLSLLAPDHFDVADINLLEDDGEWRKLPISFTCIAASLRFISVISQG